MRQYETYLEIFAFPMHKDKFSDIQSEKIVIADKVNTQLSCARQCL